MATFYVNSAWGGPFNGTLAEPFATVAGGTLAAKDPGAVPAGQEFKLLPTPQRQVGAHPRAALEYVD